METEELIPWLIYGLGILVFIGGAVYFGIQAYG